MVLIHSWSSAAPVIGPATCIELIVSLLCLLADGLRLEGSDLSESAQMPLGLTEPGRQERLDEIPGYGSPHGPATDTDNVHVIVLYALPGGEVVVDQSGPDARNLVGTN